MPPTKSKNVIQKKKSYLDGIKAISGWLFSRRDETAIRNVIEKYDFDNTILKRLTSYVYNYPHLVWYINKYMNGLYQFNKFDTVSLFYSFCYLIDVNQRNNGKKLFYLKSNDLADKNKFKIKELFHEYFDKLYDKHFNDLELNFYYDLINIGKISAEQVIEVDKHLNSGKSSINLELETLAPAATLTIGNYSVLDMTRTLSQPIQEFCDDIKIQALKRPECLKCELFGKPVVVLDTNCQDFEDIDLAFIGLNPGTEEVKANRPFVGKSGKVLRDFMSKLPSHVKWLIANIILCHTRNEKDIKKPDDCMLNCSGLVAQIFQKFPTKCFVPMGAKASSFFGINESITSANGKKYDTSACSMIPIIHPSSAANYGQMDAFIKGFQTIYNLYKTEVEKPVQYDLSAFKNIDQVKQVVASSSSINLADNKIITQLTPDLTFFDIREINDKIVKIFIDRNGEKKYLIEDYNLKFYIKSNSWKECNQISSGVDYYVNVTGKEKHFVTNKVRQKFNQIKNI